VRAIVMVALARPAHPEPPAPADVLRARLGRVRGTSRELLRSAQRVAALAASVRAVHEARPGWEGSTPALRALAQAALLGRLSRQLLAAHQIHLDVRGPRPRGPVLVAANHLGYFDPLVLAALVPGLPVAKQEAASWPLLGEAMRQLGVLFVARGEPASGAAVIRQTARLLRGGTSVLGFPEGTTSYGDGVLPLRHGLFVAARAAGVPVVPVALRYDRRDTCWVGDDPFVPHYLALSRRERMDVRVTFGPALDAAAFPDAATLARATRAVIGALQHAAHRSEVRS
jgi:1-acyl-sn-glycerol-3-phosphate acyltransferase